MVNITFFTIHSLGRPDDARLAADGIEACEKRKPVRPKRRRGLIEPKNRHSIISFAISYIFNCFIGLPLLALVLVCSQWANAESRLQRTSFRTTAGNSMNSYRSARRRNKNKLIRSFFGGIVTKALPAHNLCRL
jgi:hypothetical protein